MGGGASSAPRVAVPVCATAFGASWERTAVRGQGASPEALPQMQAAPAGVAEPRGPIPSRVPLPPADPDGAAPQVGDRAPPQQDPTARQAPRPLRLPGAGRAVVGRHARAPPRVPPRADADRQDPGPHGQRALHVHRAPEEVGAPGQRPGGPAVTAGAGGCRVGAGPLKTSQRGFYTDRRCGCGLPGRPEPCRVIPVCGRAALTLRPSPLSPPNVSLHLMSPQRPHSEMLGTLSFSGPAPRLPGPSTTSARSPPGPSPPVLGHQVALSWCPRPLVPKRRGIFFNTALIRIFLHSKPATVPRGTRGPVTGGACLSSPTAPHHTASRGTCRSRSRWPRAPEPSSVLPFLSLLVGPPHTLFSHPSPPAAPTCSSGPKLRPQGAGCDSVAHIDLALFRMSA